MVLVCIIGSRIKFNAHLITFLSQLSTLNWCFLLSCWVCLGTRLGSASVWYNKTTSKLSLASSKIWSFMHWNVQCPTFSGSHSSTLHGPGQMYGWRIILLLMNPWLIILQGVVAYSDILCKQVATYWTWYRDAVALCFTHCKMLTSHDMVSTVFSVPLPTQSAVKINNRWGYWNHAYNSSSHI